MGVIAIKKLLLVGSGRAHIHVLKQIEMSPLPSLEVTLVSPDRDYIQTGMLPGFIEGFYDKNKWIINIERLTKNAQVKWIKASALSLDAERKTLLTDKGDVLSFDIVSFDMNIQNSGSDLPDVVKYATLYDSSSLFLDRLENIRSSDYPVIVGSNKTAIEVALSLQVWRKKNHINKGLTLINETQLLPSHPAKVVEKVKRILESALINVEVNEGLPQVNKNVITTHSQKQINFSNLLWLTQARAPKLFSQAKLPTDKEGYLKVEATLQVKQFPYIFGVGHTISLTQHLGNVDLDVVCQGQAELLWENLKGYISDGEGYLFELPKVSAPILSIGNKKGLFSYGNHTLKSKLAWISKQNTLKQFILNHQ